MILTNRKSPQTKKRMCLEVFISLNHGFIDDKMNDTNSLVQETIDYLNGGNIGSKIAQTLADYTQEWNYNPSTVFENLAKRKTELYQKTSLHRKNSFTLKIKAVFCVQNFAHITFSE